MAQITFLATDDDCRVIWELIFGELKLIAFPDPWFGDLTVPALETPADVSANLAEYPREAPGLSYFLTSPDWSLEPLEFHLCEDNPNFPPHWYVSQRYGGPTIHFIPHFGYPWHTAPQQIASGMFSDYPTYYSVSDHGQVIKRPAGLATTMKCIRKRLNSFGKTVQSPSGQRAIALNGSLAAHDRGVVLRAGNIIYAPVTSRK